MKNFCTHLLLRYGWKQSTCWHMQSKLHRINVCSPVKSNSIHVFSNCHWSIRNPMMLRLHKSIVWHWHVSQKLACKLPLQALQPKTDIIDRKGKAPISHMTEQFLRFPCLEFILLVGRLSCATCTCPCCWPVFVAKLMLSSLSKS